jgi:hypothetical protein
MENMVPIASLWLAMLVSAVLVWLASSIVWMVLPWHKSDFKGLPDEDAARAVLGSQNLSPGQYFIPHAESRDAYKSPELQAKAEEGPVAIMTVMPTGMPNMGKQLLLWFVFLVWIAGIVAYVVTRTLPAGVEYLHVFQIAGTVAWMGYGMSSIADGVWFGRPWGSVFKTLFDAFIYACLTAGAFAWQFPTA